VNGCVRTMRNGSPCTRVRLNYGIGPNRVTLCNFHLKKYREEEQGVQIQVEREHDDGLHDEGKQAFADRHARGEFWVACGKCADEIAGEELGVSPDKVLRAQEIKNAMEADERTRKQVIDRVRNSLSEANDDALLSIVRKEAGNIEEVIAKNGLWQQVIARMQGVNRFGHSVSEPVDLVDAYEEIKTRTTESLVADRLDDAERHAASLFVRLSRW
jgi:hypothetical protein